MEGEGGESAENQEEDVLKDYGLLGQAEEVLIVGFVDGRVDRGIRRGLLFDAGPGEVNVEQEE